MYLLKPITTLSFVSSLQEAVSYTVNEAGSFSEYGSNVLSISFCRLPNVVFVHMTVSLSDEKKSEYMETDNLPAFRFMLFAFADDCESVFA